MAREWDKCKPRYVNGVIQRPSSKVWKAFIPLYADGRTKIMAAECVSCHVRLNANRSLKYLNRHIRTCPARGRSRASVNQDELSPVLTNVEVQFPEYGSRILKCSSGDRTPVDRCVSASPAQKRMDPKKDRNTSSTQTLHSMSNRSRTSINQDELSPMLTNVEVQFSEYGSKFLKCSSGNRTPVDRCVPALPAQKRMDPRRTGIRH